ncbi:hypothetical protein AAFF_G00114890 [Aldrovandia affinis]|uniref:Elongation factor 1-beta n=1 Tax=Aldrovandia affinis TaxID=143900 RepID=A0AAD7RSX8_9TELE|nr:hypothetical protein AAFF_G00114890 [Aldrovandia affinis]
MGFGDLKTPSGLKVLNDFLADKSYIEGYVPSQADVAVFDALSGAPDVDLCHALRWYNHIKSYQKEKASLPGVKKVLGQYGPEGVEDATNVEESKDDDGDDDDDIDLFGSDEEESEEALKLKEERLAAYNAKKSKKPTLIAKSSILLDVKPWDDETDMAKLEECVRSIELDGLLWGASKLVPVGYGIKKLQIGCVVEDDKVGTDQLEEQITAFEDYVQSMDFRLQEDRSIDWDDLQFRLDSLGVTNGGAMDCMDFTDYYYDCANYSHNNYWGVAYFDDWVGDHTPHDALRIVSMVVYSLSFVLGILGNGLLVWVTALRSKRTVSSVWLQNLASGHLLSTLFLLIDISMLQGWHWRLGRAACKLTSFVAGMSTYTSALFLVVLSLDRYLLLAHPIWAHRARTVPRAWGVCAVVWGVAAALGCPGLIYHDTFDLGGMTVCHFAHHDGASHMAVVTVHLVVGFLVPISVSGALMAAWVRRASPAARARLSSFSHTVLAFVLAFVLCWAPYHIFMVMELMQHRSAWWYTGFSLAINLAVFHCWVNPVLYALLGRKARSPIGCSCLGWTERSLRRRLSESVSATEMVYAPDSTGAEVPLPTAV